MIKENVNDFLEKIETDDVRKEFLTSEELKKLAATPCDIPVLKQASLFSCLTGLRISDILNLAWDDIQLAPDLGYCVRIRIQKTDTETMLPISDEALQLCGERTEGKVFRGLTRSMVNYPLRKWIAAAGIKKHISFHCFRHTYATLQIASGTDIYTVSKILSRAKSTVYALTQAHKIPFYQPGKMLQFKRSELMAWMESARQDASSQTTESIAEQMRSTVRHKPKSNWGM